MRMSVENLDTIRSWAIRNQDALPELTLRLIFAADLGKSVIEQEAAPDPKRVIEIGYDIANLMWSIRVACGSNASASQPASPQLGAGTRVILQAMRRGIEDTAAIVEFIDNKVGRTIFAADVIGHDPILGMPEFGFREIAVQRDGGAYVFEDTSDSPCRSSRIKNLAASISKVRQAR